MPKKEKLDPKTVCAIDVSLMNSASGMGHSDPRPETMEVTAVSWQPPGTAPLGSSTAFKGTGEYLSGRDIQRQRGRGKCGERAARSYVMKGLLGAQRRLQLWLWMRSAARRRFKAEVRDDLTHIEKGCLWLLCWEWGVHRQGPVHLMTSALAQGSSSRHQHRRPVAFLRNQFQSG